jgi:hypothetical protein
VTTGPGPGFAPIGSYTYSYDFAGNLCRSLEDYPASSIADRTLTNTYDLANRLKVETVQTAALTKTSTYGYDTAHNRASLERVHTN